MQACYTGIGRMVQAVGERAVAIGGSVVQRGTYNIAIGRASGLAIGHCATVHGRNESEEET